MAVVAANPYFWPSQAPGAITGSGPEAQQRRLVRLETFLLRKFVDNLTGRLELISSADLDRYRAGHECKLPVHDLLPVPSTAGMVELGPDYQVIVPNVRTSGHPSFTAYVLAHMTNPADFIREIVDITITGHGGIVHIGRRYCRLPEDWANEGSVPFSVMLALVGEVTTDPYASNGRFIAGSYVRVAVYWNYHVRRVAIRFGAGPVEGLFVGVDELPYLLAFHYHIGGYALEETYDCTFILGDDITRTEMVRDVLEPVGYDRRIDNDVSDRYDPTRFIALDERVTLVCNSICWAEADRPLVEGYVAPWRDVDGDELQSIRQIRYAIQSDPNRVPTPNEAVHLARGVCHTALKWTVRGKPPTPGILGAVGRAMNNYVRDLGDLDD